MKKLIIIGLLSCMSVEHLAAMDMLINSSKKYYSKSSQNSTSSHGSFIMRSQQQANGSALFHVLLLAGYAAADYFEKVPNFLSVRHGIGLLRGKTEEDLTMQDVLNDFKKDDVALKEEGGWGKKLLIGGAATCVVLLLLGSVANNRNRTIRRSQNVF